MGRSNAPFFCPDAVVTSRAARCLLALTQSAQGKPRGIPGHGPATLRSASATENTVDMAIMKNSTKRFVWRLPAGRSESVSCSLAGGAIVRVVAVSEGSAIAFFASLFDRSMSARTMQA